MRRATGITSADKLFHMEPNSLGRKLGVGVRVASRMLLERASQGSPPTPPVPDVVAPTRQSQVYAGRGKGVARGTRKFGEAMWKPLAHASGVLWLEVTGLFFGVFTFFFGMNTYKLRYEWAVGPDHQRFLVYGIVTLIFGYFTFSSFYRARKKEKLRKLAKE